MRRRSLLLVVLCTGLLAQRATANVQHGITRRDLMPKIKDMHAEIKCDACLTTVERFMAMWKAVTSKVTLHVQHAPHCVFSDYAGPARSRKRRATTTRTCARERTAPG